MLSPLISRFRKPWVVLLGAAVLSTSACIGSAPKPMTDEQASALVERTYQYVTLFNINNKFATDETNPTNTGGWNKAKANTELADHTVQALPRPNNDTLYEAAMLDLRDEPVIVEFPAFDSNYVSLMVTAYDHYVNIPKSTLQGDFGTAQTIMYYSPQTKSVPVELPAGVDEAYETTGNFVSAVLRVMPHANEPARMQKNIVAMEAVNVKTLSEYLGGKAKTTHIDFPAFSDNSVATYGSNFAEVMQFVANHTVMDKDFADDAEVLKQLAKVGIVPGQDKPAVGEYLIDNEQLARVSLVFVRSQLAVLGNLSPEILAAHLPVSAQPKGQTTHEAVKLNSVTGPIGMPIQEAVYNPVMTADGTPINAKNNYVLRMTKEQLPPVHAFWSVTLYDTANGFFIPNEQYKYSVGENAGYELNAEGGIEIYLSAEKPEGVPAANWLPINRGDETLDLLMRLYNPNLPVFAKWKMPVLEQLN